MVPAGGEAIQLANLWRSIGKWVTGPLNFGKL